jgi:7,8-dihydroneopterin aldolase/epimerase/oxygenase
MIAGMDRIVLSGLEFFARHGVFPEETVLGGRFLVDIEMFVPLSNVINLEDTVNYASVFEVVSLEMTEQHALIESLANRIAARVLADHALVVRVIVRVHKPHAPIAGVFRDVFVEVDRSRSLDQP